MTTKQFDQIVEFCKPYYKKTGRWHAWDHITAVQNLSLAIAEAEFPNVNNLALKAAATIHDMGRTVKDEGHAEESGRIAEPFLRSINLPEEEINIILDAVTHHDIKRINESKTTAARIMFDADKIEIFSIYGFTRVAYWLVEERHMELGEAIRFLWDFCLQAKPLLYSDYAKKIVSRDQKMLEEFLDSFNSYENTWRKRG